MNAVDALLLAFDAAWKDEWESLRQACHDLSEEESVWQPPSYAREPHDKGVGRPGTILWHLNHLELCHRHYVETIKRKDPANSPETDPPGELPLRDALKALGNVTLDLRNTVAELQPDDLKSMVRPTRNLAQFIAMFTRHMSWHAAQIQQTRRLCARRAKSAQA